MNCRRTFLALAAAFAVTASAALAAPAPFVLAKDGKAQIAIVPHGGLATNGVNFAAAELTNFLHRITGAEFPISAKPVPGLKTLALGTPYKAKAVDEISVRVKDASTLDVTGDGAVGTVYAAYDLLETFGCVFVAHDFAYAPLKGELSLPGDYAKTDAPFTYEKRSTWSEIGYGGDRSKWSQILRTRMQVTGRKPGMPEDLVCKRQHDTNHSIGTRWLLMRKFEKTRPDFYAWVRKANARNCMWVCVSNEEMYQEVFTEIDEYLSKHPDQQELSVAIGDCANFCECDKCTALVRKYPDPDGAEAWNVQCVLFANRIGEHFARKYPKVRFNFLPYGGRQPANPEIKLAENVGACVAELWRNHGLSADNNERSDLCLGRICRMASPRCGAYVWDYLGNFNDFLIPYPNHTIFAQTAQYYRDLNIRGVSPQMQFVYFGDLAEFNFWLFGKLTWNPDADLEELIDTYMNAAYGNGARFVREYFDLLEHARLRQRWTWYGCYVNETAHYLTDDDCAKMLRALDNAVNATNGDKPRNMLARRTRIAALSLALWRYNDMIEPAKRLGYALRPRETIWKEWKEAIFAPEHKGANYGMLGENFGTGGYEQRVTNMFAQAAAVPTVFPRKASVIRIDPGMMTGGKKMTRQRDKDGTPYAQLKVALHGEEEGIWMNPGYAEIGYTAKADETGDWYVFATVRTGATVPVDIAAAYMGIYQKWYPNGVKTGGNMETANLKMQGRLGDTAWHTISLGRRRLFDGSRVWIMNGVINPCDFIDVREFILVDPALIEKGAKGTDPKAQALSVVIGADAFDKGANVRVEEDQIDSFKYARAAAFNTNAPVGSVSWTVKAAEAGDWNVFLKIRIGAAIALDQDPAQATLTTPKHCTECGAVQTPTRLHVTGALGDESWQLVSLGRAKLTEGMQVNLVPRAAGTNDLPAPHYVDLASVILVDPAYLAKTQPALSSVAQK